MASGNERDGEKKETWWERPVEVEAGVGVVEEKVKKEKEKRDEIFIPKQDGRTIDRDGNHNHNQNGLIYENTSCTLHVTMAKEKPLTML